MNYELKVHEVHGGKMNLNLKEVHFKKNLHNPSDYHCPVHMKSVRLQRRALSLILSSLSLSPFSRRSWCGRRRLRSCWPAWCRSSLRPRRSCRRGCLAATGRWSSPSRRRVTCPDTKILLAKGISDTELSSP